MKLHKLYPIFLCVFVLFGCKKNSTKQVKINQNNTFKLVTAIKETEAVKSKGDAADDACIWINPVDSLKSTIIATNKKQGLEVYNLDGKKLFSYKIGRENNVDIRNGFLLNGKQVSVVTATNRTTNTLSILYVKPTGELEEIAAKPIFSQLKEVYGLGMYKSKKSGKFYTFIVGKSGKIEQWELFENNQKIDAKIVRNLDLGAKGEGIVADDYYGKIYISEEDTALWKYDAEPNSSTKKEQVISTKHKNMKDDFEGVTLYDTGNGRGYILLSSQGNNSYAVLDRITNKYKGSFRIANGTTIDGTNDTDGIDATSFSFGGKYPNGFFIAQDGANTKGKDSLNQNFKIVDWKQITKVLELE
ncbi:MAG: phytase [Polaribacter sp.]